MNPVNEEEMLVHEVLMTELLNTTQDIEHMRMLYTIIEKKREEIVRTENTIKKLGNYKGAIRRRGAMNLVAEPKNNTDLKAKLILVNNDKIKKITQEISQLENQINMIIARYQGVDVQIIQSLRPGDSILKERIQQIMSTKSQMNAFGKQIRKKRKSKRRSRKRKSKKRKSKKRKSKKRN